MCFYHGFATVTFPTAALVADLTGDGRYGSSMGVLRRVTDVGRPIGPVATAWVAMVGGHVGGLMLPAAMLVAAAQLSGAGLGVRQNAAGKNRARLHFVTTAGASEK